METTGIAVGPKKVIKRQITISVAPELLDRVDEMVQKTGQTRSGIISLAIYQIVNHGMLLKER